MKQLLISIFLIFTLTCCMMEPYKQAFDKGSGPFPENYLEVINGFMNENLENPKSIKNLKVIKPPEKIVIDQHHESISLAKGNEVWEIFISLEAKNRNGKYVTDFHVVWIRNDRIVAYDYQKPGLEYRFEHRFDPEPAPEKMPEDQPEESEKK
ncbi:MAG: hypothetical protein PF482_22215 [Desulfobacteraceae bacterium]|nr:hypothetical protein [Desulfobacteraceae bacterium]